MSEEQAKHTQGPWWVEIDPDTDEPRADAQGEDQ
jgi:hypothetical protein